MNINGHTGHAPATAHQGRCILCDAPTSRSGPELPGYRTCRNCDHTWYEIENTNSDPDDKDSFGDWDKDYYRDSQTFEFHKTRRSAFGAIIRRLSVIRPERGRLLDLGTGLGLMMEAALQDGWSVEGVEPSEKAAEWAHRLTGATVHKGCLEMLNLPEKSYDVITMVDVLRTIPDFIAVLRLAMRLLSPGGILLIRESHRRVLRRIRRAKDLIKVNAIDQSPAAIHRGCDHHGFSPASLLYAIRKVGIGECWVEPSPVFVEPAPGRGWLVPLIKTTVCQTSLMVHWASGQRVVMSPTFLALGRIAQPGYPRTHQANQFS